MTIRAWSELVPEVEADVVIVGTGPGGAAIARVLAAERGMRVVLLEEGPAKSNFRPSNPHTMRYHMQEGGAMIAFGQAAVSVAAGRGVGGGSLVNSAICWQTPDHVLDGWTRLLGDDRFSPAKMAPVYEEIGQIIGVTMTSEDIAGENNKLIVRGANAIGLPGGLLYRNAPTCIGCGSCNTGCPSGGKASVDRNLLAIARASGAVIQADAKVDRILVEGGRAAGVHAVVRHQDTNAIVGEVTVRAPRVILSAGAVGTPRLLHHCGLAGQLGDRVGKGLHLHPGNAIFGLCDEEIRMWTGATQGAWFADPAYPEILPHTISIPPGPLMLVLGEVGANAKAQLDLLPRLCGCLVMVSDKGEGTVSAKGDGSSNLTYWFTDGDVENMRIGLKRTCEVLRAGGAKKLLVPCVGGGWKDTIEDAFAAIDRATLRDWRLLYAAHPMATCRMGNDIATSVIGVDGEAHGLPGLTIADSSIFPTSLGVNPQWTTMVMATIIGRNLVV